MIQLRPLKTQSHNTRIAMSCYLRQFTLPFVKEVQLQPAHNIYVDTLPCYGHLYRTKFCDMIHNLVPSLSTIYEKKNTDQK